MIKASKKEPFLAASLELDLALIAELMLLTREQVSTDESAVPGLGCAVAPAAIIDALDRMIRLIEAPHEIPILLPGIKREIHYRLLACPIGHLLRQFWGLGASHASIAQLVSRIKNNPSEVLHIPNIAQQVGMSAATLHRKFKIITGLSPIRFQKRLRLLEARRRLLANAATASQAAHSVGYESVPQFTREYGRLFGSSPLQDKLRAQADFSKNSQAN